MTAYVALLRGINLGKRRIKMDALRHFFETLGYTNISTLQASGNVLFTSPNKKTSALASQIEAGMQAAFGFGADTIVRSAAELATLVAAQPFQHIKAVEGQRTHITFLKPDAASKTALPYDAPDGSFSLWTIDAEHLACLVQPQASSLSYMDFLDKAYGAAVTTRTWGTVQKIQHLLEAQS